MVQSTGERRDGYSSAPWCRDPGAKPRHQTSTPALVSARDSGIRIMSEIELCIRCARTYRGGHRDRWQEYHHDDDCFGGQWEGAAIVAGNIGIPFSERVLAAALKIFWSLRSVPSSCGLSDLRLKVADHQCCRGPPRVFRWQRQAYADAKARLLRDLGHGDTAIYKDDAIVSTMDVPSDVQRVPFGPTLQGQGWPSPMMRSAETADRFFLRGYAGTWSS